MVTSGPKRDERSKMTSRSKTTSLEKVSGVNSSLKKLDVDIIESTGISNFTEVATLSWPSRIASSQAA